MCKDNNNNNYALVTGASSGIGREFAIQLARMGYPLILVARREKRLERLARLLREHYGTESVVLAADLSTSEACYELFDRIGDRQLALVVNDAGFGDCSRFEDGDADKELAMVDVNVKAMHLVFKLSLQKMLRQGQDRCESMADRHESMPDRCGSTPGRYESVPERCESTSDRRSPLVKSERKEVCTDSESAEATRECRHGCKKNQGKSLGCSCMVSGRILNVASSAGLLPAGPYMATYYATKSYVASLTQAVAEEQREAGTGIYVGCLCPGPVDTEFDQVANVHFSLPGITARECVAYALQQMYCGQTVIVPGVMMRMGVFASRFVPRRALVRMAGSQQKRKMREP